MRNAASLTALGLLVAALWGSQVDAAIIHNATGVSGPHTTILFSEFGLAGDTVVTNQYSSLGATFSPNLYQNPQFFPGPNVDPTPDSLSNFSFSGGSTTDPFSIFFNTVQSEAAFAIISNPNTTVFEAYLGNVLVESFSATTDTTSTTNFFGFSGIAFDEIRVNVGGDGFMILDNLQLTNLAAVPEPATMTIWGFSALGCVIGAYHRRKRS